MSRKNYVQINIKDHEEQDRRECFDMLLPKNCPGQVFLINNIKNEEIAKESEKVLKDTFEALKFSFHVEKSELSSMRKGLYENLSSFNEKLIKQIKDNVSYYGSIIVFVLTHQQQDGRLIAKDRSYDSNEIITPFHKYKELDEIPKIFFFLIYNENCDTSIKSYKVDSSTYLSSIPKLKGSNFLISFSPAYADSAKNICEALRSWQGSNDDLINLLHKVDTDVIEASIYQRVISSSLQKGIIFSARNKNEDNQTQDALPLRTLSTRSNETSDLGNSRHKGRVLIYNTDRFKNLEFHESRIWRTAVNELVSLFGRQRFKVSFYNNMTWKDMEESLQKFANEDFSDYGSLWIFIITQSYDNMLYAYDGLYHANLIWRCFQDCNKSLLEKPKLFFIPGQINLRDETKIQKNTVLSFSGTDDEKSNATMISFIHKTLMELQHRKIDILMLLTKVQMNVVSMNADATKKGLNPLPFFISTLTKQFSLSGFDESKTSKESKPKKKVPESITQPADELENDSVTFNVDDITRQSSSDDETSSDNEMTNGAISPDTKIYKHMFGLLKYAEEIVNDKFKSAIEEFKDGTVDDFKSKLNDYKETDNIQFLAKELLHLIFTNDRYALAVELIGNFDLPQEEILYFLWRIITDSVWREDLFKGTCNALKIRYKKICFLRYHMDFTHRDKSSIRGFPILCALQTPCGDVSIMKNKIEMLIEYGAQVSDCYKESEETPSIKFAEDNKMKKEIVTLLNNKSKKEIESASSVLQKKLFKSLYTKNETEFITLFESNIKRIDKNAHDGKYTLLQLAINNNLSKAAQKLFDNGAKQSMMAGYCKEPIIIALEISNVEILELFLANDFNLNLRFCSDNSTFLHHLSKNCTHGPINSRHYLTQLKTLVEKAIEQFIRISAIDMDRKTSLEMCAESSNLLLKILLDNGGFLNIDDKIASALKPKDLAEYFKEKIQVDPLTKIKIDYSYLRPLTSTENKNKIANFRAAEMLPFLEIAKWEKFHEILIQSPVTKVFILNKWKQFSFIFVLNFILTLFFTISFTLYVYYKLQRQDADFFWLSYETMKTGEITCSLLLLIFWVLLLLREIYQFATTSMREYVTEIENYIEIFKLILTFLTFILTANTLSNSEFRFIPAFAITLSYIEITLLLRTHPWAEAYITMFKEVSKKTFKLLILFLCFILAFVGGFYILLQVKNFEYLKNDNHTSPNTTDEFYIEIYNSSTISDKNVDKNIFSHLWHSLLKTSVMLLGEFDIKDMLEYTNFSSEILFLTFLIFVPIILLNLLNALAISDTQIIVKKTQLLCCISNIKLYHKMESAIFQYSKENPGNRCYGFDILSNRNIISKLICKVSMLFDSDISEFSKEKYSITISLKQNRTDEINKRGKCNKFPTNIKKWFINFYKKYLMKIDDYNTAKKIAKRYSGKIYKSNISYKKDVTTMATNADASEIKELRSEINQIKDDLANTRLEMKSMLDQHLKEIKQILETQASVKTATT